MKQVVLITGASSGIGKETARLLSKMGYIVYAAARRTEKMSDLQALGVNTLELDITNDASVQKAIGEIISSHNRIDVLVNNAVYGSYGSLEDVPMEEAKYQFEVNIFGLARLTQLVIPYMRKQRSGRIVNISSMGGKFGEPHGAWYHATKFALEGLSDSLRMELKQFGIEVVVIQPGAIKTEWNKIARENLLSVSGTTAYKELAGKHAAFLEKGDGSMGSEPMVIAKAIAKAVTSRKPKTRYVAGAGARPMLFLKSILSDRMFDKFLLGLMR
ncbi:MAG: oxidoreductase [Bacteroidia bacterium]|nr:oxidoreductase [Bacteroidia bacterium]